MLRLPKLILVTGGAASGKSAFAERLVKAATERPIYMATASVYDAEMAEKVAAHKAARGQGWQTVEVPLALHDVLFDIGPEHVVLVDCATLWLTNVLMADNDLEVAVNTLCESLATTKAKAVVIVSNELGQGIVPDNAMARAFRNHHGRMNQRIAQQADWVFTVISGLPLALKGPDPNTLL